MPLKENGDFEIDDSLSEYEDSAEQEDDDKAQDFIVKGTR